MTASSTFDVIFVGAGHHPYSATSESFIDDPEDFKKRSRTGSPDENRTSPNTYWLCGRLLRDAPGVAESTRAQGRRDG
jgi:hypothetical protein